MLTWCLFNVNPYIINYILNIIDAKGNYSFANTHSIADHYSSNNRVYQFQTPKD
jgi:hypothetical protein